MKCKVCNNNAYELFNTNVLNKYLVKYYKCKNCEFIQTEEPYWLDEAYASPISFIDVGILHRNIYLSNEVPKIIEKYDTSNSIYLDYGGGYGIFVRLMRDKGFNFYLSEIYADNLFCKHFTFEDAGIKTGFTSLTSFEVFEHLLDPMADIKTMFSMSDTIIFSTQLQPNFQLSKSEDWWYFVPEGGQHISFYSIRTLEVISEIFNCYLYSNGTDIHILTKKIITNPFKDSKFNYTLIDRLMRWVKKKPKNEFFLKETLLYKDFDFYKKIINGRNI